MCVFERTKARLAEAGGGHPRKRGCFKEHWCPRHVAVGHVSTEKSGEKSGGNKVGKQSPAALVEGAHCVNHVPRLRGQRVGTGGEKRAAKNRANFETVLEGEADLARRFGRDITHSHTVDDLPHDPLLLPRREAPEGHHAL